MLLERNANEKLREGILTFAAEVFGTQIVRMRLLRQL